MTASPLLDLGTPVRLIRTVITNTCCFAEGRRGVVVAILVNEQAYDIEFDDPYQTVGRIAGIDLEALLILYVRNFGAEMLSWLSDYTPDHRVRPGSVFGQREIVKLVFGRAEDVALFRMVWPETIVTVPPVTGPVPAPAPASAPDPVQATQPPAAPQQVNGQQANGRVDAARRAAAHARATALMPQAVAGGLRFSVYLPPGLAKWVLKLVADGIFADPAEAVFTGMSEYHDLMPHADIRTELLHRSLQKALDAGQPSVDAVDFVAGLQKKLASPLPEPAIWLRQTPKPGEDGLE